MNIHANVDSPGLIVVLWFVLVAQGRVRNVEGEDIEETAGEFTKTQRAFVSQISTGPCCQENKTYCKAPSS